MIQKAIREQFKTCTVLTVAHRLRTVIDNDRIMVITDNLENQFCHFLLLLKVLNRGKLIEFDKPSVLLNDSNSHFSSFVDQAGAAEAEYLRKLLNISNESIDNVNSKHFQR